MKVLQVRRTPRFIAWLAALRDRRAFTHIARRLTRAENGNLGDHRSVGDGVSELRIDVGPGYRIYYVRRGERLLVLLAGGDKSSQSRDIEEAKALARLWSDEGE